MLAIILATTAGFVIGAIIGYVVCKVITFEEPIGDLRMDESIPEDGLRLFLELERVPNNLKSRKQVTLNVKVENYISQK